MKMWLKCNECGRLWYARMGDVEQVDEAFKSYFAHMDTEHGQKDVTSYASD